MRIQWVRSAAAIGAPSGRTKAGCVRVAGDAQVSAQLEAAASVVLVREVGDAPRGHLLGRRAGGQQRLAQPRLARDERLAAEQLAQRVELALGLAGERLARTPRRGRSAALISVPV